MKSIIYSIGIITLLLYLFSCGSDSDVNNTVVVPPIGIVIQSPAASPVPTVLPSSTPTPSPTPIRCERHRPCRE